MSKLLLSLACVAAITVSSASGSLALPKGGIEISVPSRTEPLVQDVRLFCYNRYSGRFLHWGGCGYVSRPRVYCRNRYTGRFLHWGSCF